jgi:FHS family glucose/mannose:H+ symporter-like MFS transporter
MAGQEGQAGDAAARQRAEQVSWLGYAIIGLMATAYGAALPELVHQLRASYGELSLLFAMQSLGNTVTYFYANHLVDHQGTRRVLQIGFWLFFAATALLPVIPDFAVWVVLALLAGVAFALVDVGGSRLVSDLHRQHQAQAFNRLNLWFGIGAISAPLAVGLLNGAGLPVTLVFALAAALAVLGAMGITAIGAVPGEPAQPGPGLRGNFELWRGEAWLRTLTWLVFLYVAAESGFSAWVAAFVHVRAGLPDAIASLYPAAYQVGLTVTRLLIGPRLPLLRLERVLVLGAAAAVGSSAVVVSFGHSPIVVLVAAALTGACLGPAFPIILTVAGREAPRREGQAFFFIFTSLAIAALVVPWAEGQVFMQLPELAMAATSVLVAGMAILAARLGKETAGAP